MTQKRTRQTKSQTKKKTSSTRKNQSQVKEYSQVIGVILLVLSGFALTNSGFIGSVVLGIAGGLFGTYRYFVIFYLMIFGIFLLIDRTYILFKTKYGLFINLLFFNFYLEIMQNVFLKNSEINYIEQLNDTFASTTVKGLGVIGYAIGDLIYFLVGHLGLQIMIVVLWIVTALILFDYKELFASIHLFTKEQYGVLKNKRQVRKEEATVERRLDRKINQSAKPKETFVEPPKFVKETVKLEPDFEIKTTVKEENVSHEPIVTRIDNIDYQIPSIELLTEYENGNGEQIKELQIIAQEKAEALLATLASFKLNVKISNIHIGPNVTKYELQPELGVKVSRFSSLSNDIALALAAKAVRIEAPIPGKSAIGIEIPNDKPMMVGLREVLSSSNNEMDKKLQVGLGKDISGESIFIEIDKTPHLLVAGSTGSGKSVCINGIIISLLTKTSPQDVKMIMIDPKKVELTPFNGIPHLLTPVVTDPKKAAAILKKMVVEMEYRYELFAETNTRNIAGYNKKVEAEPTTFKKLPYIVIIIDELADLMMVASHDVEEAIARLAQMARAAGIHLIIATQRPSTDVITGLIKANIPSRIAFAVSSSIDSRTILDSSGAEKLLGKGDMLLTLQGSNAFTRIQGAFIDDGEVMDVVNEIINQFPAGEIEKAYAPELEAVSSGPEIDDEIDDLYEDVKRDVIQMQKASASHIQRRYKVGFNRAMRILDQLEANGVIAPSEGTKPRKVLMEENYED